ncbi:MAG: hypothetical protein SNF33_02105 [Candidatus Algichlamydia australiensis]|nr:hypothetical protein [Chlamydiales bacterium]
MKKFFRNTLFFISSAALIFGVERLCHAATDGFTLTRVRSDFTFEPAYVTPSCEAALKEIFTQPFTYLSSGSQCYVFLSEDKQTILKLFKNHRFGNIASLFDKKRKLKRIESFHDTLTSCLFSHKEFRDETRVFYVHLGKTEDPALKAHLVDKLNIHHYLDLNSTQFHLQKCATSVPQYLLSLRKKGAHEEAKLALDALLDISEKRALLGFNDKDPHLIHNFGFIDGQAVQVDAVGFSPNKSRDKRRFYTKEILKIRAKVMPWLEENYPEIIPHVESQLTSFYDTPDHGPGTRRLTTH